MARKDDNDAEKPAWTPPHQQTNLIGHEAAERQLIAAFRSGRLHHAWMLTGPRGLGKATLAYRFARFTLHYRRPEAVPRDQDNLAIPVDSSTFRRVAAEAHPDLITVSRSVDPRSGRLRGEIVVEDARRIGRLLAHTAGEGGWRICIIDSMDEMNHVAANTLLKNLEEPPGRTLFLLVSHVPGRALATIRSRCVRLALAPLGPEDTAAAIASSGRLGIEIAPEAVFAAADLAAGAPGRALRLLEGGGAELLEKFNALVERAPGLEMVRVIEFAESLRGVQSRDSFRLFAELIDAWLAARIGRAARGLDDWSGRMTPPVLGRWAETHDQISRSIGRANALNLDRRHVVMSALRLIDETARAARAA